MTISFTKMQGLGNDFMVIDATKQPFYLHPQQIRDMSDRRFGIGFDQLLVVERPQQATADFFFRIFNADGSEVAQCGNGARCIARFVKKMGLTDKTTFIVQTQQTTMQLTLVGDDCVKVDMGQPRFSPQQIPFLANEIMYQYDIELNNQLVQFAVVNVGNPHAVILVDDLKTADIANIGGRLSVHPQFPEGVNVGFMQILNRQQIQLRVFERGAGETLACGSGACAAMVIGKKQNLLADEVIVHQHGGDLTIRWFGEDASIEMIGSAEFVYEGKWLR